MGLVETSVGLIPGGGGCKEMLLRALECAPANARGDEAAIFDALKKNFETIAMAKVSTSAADARALGFLRPSDDVTMNRARLLTDAAKRAREIADAGYSAPVMRTDVPAPGESVLATLKYGAYLMREAGFISDRRRRWRIGQRMRCAAGP